MNEELPELRFAGPTSEAAWREAEGQGTLAPGDEGWWKVWGARPHDVIAGDIVLYQTADGQEAMLVTDRFPAKSWPMRQGWIVEGEQITMGSLVPMIVLRRGTHHTLAASL